jgi:oligoendopeptidase F
MIIDIKHKSKEASLPEWNLSDLYNGTTDPAINRDLNKAEELARRFSTRYKGKLTKLNGNELGVAIKSFEFFSEVLSRITSFSQLKFSANMEDVETSKFRQNINERVTLITTLMLFFELEINKIDSDNLSEMLKLPEVGYYKSWVDAVRVHKPYQLSDDLEKIIHEKSVVGNMAWVRLFDETLSGIQFVVNYKKLNSSEVLTRMSDKNPSIRRDAAKAFGKGLKENIRLFSLITNTLAKDKEIDDRWRGFPHPVSSRNLQNQVEDEVVYALRDAVRKSYPAISHRYYKLKAQWLELDTLEYWDRNAPLPEADEKYVLWDEAKNIVLSTYREFDSRLGQIATEFFDNPWIDAKPRQGKESGAFSHPTVPSVHPYILMNYHGKFRDVMTLAHELGHGIHQVLAADQGYLLADTPLTLAETASVFGEMLTFQSLLRATKGEISRKVLLASKVEDMLNTVVRQIAFYEFEEKVHEERRLGEIDSERLGDIWMSVQKESLGPAFQFDNEYRYFWAHIPHFIHAPFYVYSYAFGDCLVNSLYDLFSKDHPKFQQKYFQMLQAGGSLRYNELLTPFELDASDPSFWKRGLDVISSLVDQLEEC